MENKRQKRNNTKLFNKIAYYQIDYILGFLSLKEIIICLTISDSFSSSAKRLGILENFKKVINYLKKNLTSKKDISLNRKLRPNEKVLENNIKGERKDKINLNSYRSEDIIFINTTDMNVIDNDTKNTNLLEKLNILDMIKNDGKFIKSIEKNLNIPLIDSTAIFGYLIELNLNLKLNTENINTLNHHAKPCFF